jgi:hypothetical protein
MPFPPKKKPAMSDLAAPEPMEAKKKAPVSAQPDVEEIHEQGESNMDFAAIGEKFGLSEDESKAFAYDVLEACMKATGGAKHEEDEPELDVNESETENYPA